MSDIAEIIDKSKRTANKHLTKLEEEDLIQVEKTDHQHIRTITDEGIKALANNPLDSSGVNGSGKQVDPYFVHFFAVNCEFDDKNFLPEDWRERFKEFEFKNIEEHEDFDRIQVTYDKWVYRLTGRSLEIRLSDEVSGSDVRELKDRAWSQAMEGLDKFEEHLQRELDRPDFEFPRDRMTIRIQSQHIGARRRHLSKAFIDHIDNNTVLNAKDFRVVGDDEEIRIYCDASGPGGMLEGEAGNGGQINGRMDTAQDDMELLQEFTNDLIESPGSARRVVDSPQRLDEVEKRIEAIERSMESFSKTVSNSLQQITSTVENNIAEGPQVQKQVMEMKQVQDGLQDELSQVNDRLESLISVQERSQAVQSSRSESDRDIVEKLDEISEEIGSSGSVVNPLASEVEVSSKWEDRWGNIRAYSPDLDKQFKLIDADDIS